MKRTEDKHQEIIDGLKGMPDITDDTDKEVLYSRISSVFSESHSTKKRKTDRKLIPILSTVAAAAIILMIPFMLQIDIFQSNNETAELFSVDETAYDDASHNSNKMESANEEQERSVDTEDSEAERTEEMSEQNIDTNDSLTSFTTMESSEPYQIVYAAIPDNQQQFIIPISFLVPENADLEAYYNSLESYMDMEEMELNNYMLKDASFELEESEVRIRLDDEFSIGDGSANAHIFEQTLSAMFTPYGIDKAVFQSENGGIDMGPFGVIEELSLNRNEEIYKLYKNQFLIPVPNSNNLSITDAIAEMKVEQTEFNINQTIPETVQYTADSSGNELILTLQDETSFENSQEVLIMIEAILMTAKSYGYEYVQFNNLPFDEIGNYNTSEPIKVPEGANPVDLRN
ncbi:hypothetical protein [Oceanobacillus damuensis]|uniref:hypothetical protein n=1 Tax=Oceanobacillus damuensis TaxID=937928 RepID=UPI000832F974|nr:hypothetical protein [Oceanobacillus damuensis]